MKTVFAFMMLFFTFMLVSGCRRESATSVTSQEPQAGRIEIVLNHDTLRFLTGDSASTWGFVIVHDTEGRFMSGAAVTFGNSQPGLGHIEISDPSVSDTTDGMGRVYFQYRSAGYAGEDLISAQCGTQIAQRAVVLIESEYRPGSITIIPDTLYIHHWWDEDSVLVIACWFDTTGVGVPGFEVCLRATGGRIAPLPPTDSTGCVRYHWYTNFAPPGQYWVRFGCRTASDSASLTLIYDIDSRPPVSTPRDSL